MLRKSVKITLETISIVSMLGMLAVIAFVIWVMVAPRSLAFITPYIEKELSSVNQKTSVTIENSYIKWSKKQHAIMIHAKNVHLLNDTKDTVANFPEISFAFSILRLLQGRLLSSDLTISEPSFYINTANRTLYATSESSNSLEGAVFNSVYEALRNNNVSFKINSVKLRDAKLFISTGVSDMIWKIDEGYAKLETLKGTTKIKSEFKINFGKDSAGFSINIAGTKDKKINAEINFQELPSYTLDDIFPNYDIERKVNMTFSGMGKLIISEDGVLSGAQLLLDKADGLIDMPEFFKDTISVKNLKMDASLDNGFSNLTINNMYIDLHGPHIRISGNFKNTKQFPEFLPSIDAAVEIENMDMEELANYWPYNFGAVTYEWVMHDIKEGFITSANGKFKFSAEDINNIIERERNPVKNSIPPISNEAIDAIINIENAKLNYFPGFPLVENIKAAVKFTGQTMDAQIESARTLELNISNAHAKFENMWEHPSRIDITGDYVGNASDLVAFIKASYMENPNTEELKSIYNMTGDASGSVEISIPLLDNLKYNDSDIKVLANLKNAKFPALINGKDVFGQDLNVVLHKNDINVTGAAVLNNVLAQVDLHKNFSEVAANEIKLNLKGSFSPPEIKDLGLVDLPFVTGKMGLDINLLLNDAMAEISGKADLTQSQVVIDNIGFEKNPGKKGSVTFKVIRPYKSDIIIEDFKLAGEGFSINGSGVVSENLGGFKDLSLTQARFGSSDFVATIKSSPNSSSFDVTGKSLDLSKAKISEWFRPDADKNKKSLSINANLATLYMKNGEEFQGFKAGLSCTEVICKNGNLYGKFRGGNFIVMSLKNLGERSILLAESDNAGAIINALNISRNITGGHLNIESTLGKSDGSTVAQGVIKISNFTAIRTPLLGKILTLASLGFEDLLNNQGISFRKFEAPFTMVSGIITVANAKSSGSSIGITAEGTVDTTSNEVDLKGVIVPAYYVNNIIGKIPFVGKIIIGKENEGILATKYSIKGSYDNAKVSVNSLSILTPGFLRNIFDIFD